MSGEEKNKKLTRDEYLDLPVMLDQPEVNELSYLKGWLNHTNKKIAMPPNVCRCADIVGRRFERGGKWTDHEALALLSVAYHVGQMVNKAKRNKEDDNT